MHSLYSQAMRLTRKHGKSFPLMTAVSICALAHGLSSVQAQGLSEQSQQVAIESRSLSAAIVELSRETGVPIIAPSDLTNGKAVQPFSGNYTVLGALEILLLDTGLHATTSYDDGNVPAGTAIGGAQPRMIYVSRIQEPAVTDSSDTEQKRDKVMPPEEDTIVVTGYRSSNVASIEAKREAEGIIDAISQDEVGLLPDLTISEVARRIPGVATVSLDGPEGIRSVNNEPNVLIRGLSPSFNLTTFDSVPIASTSENERAENLSIIPPTMIRRLEAVKTLTADLNPHALSGQLNLVTASAFDRDGRFLTTRFSVGDNSTAGKGNEDQGANYRGSLTYSDIFGVQDQIGLVLSASYEQFYSTSYDYRPGATTGTYIFYDDEGNEVTNFDASNGLPAARRVRHYFYENSQERASAVAKLEFEPSDATYGSLFAGVFYQNETEAANQYLIAANNGIPPASQTLTSGDWAEAVLIPTFIDQPQESLTSAITAKLRHDLDDRQSLAFAASFSRADVENGLNAALFWDEVFYSPDTGFSYNLSSGTPELTFADPAATNDISNWVSQRVQERGEDLEQDLAYLSAAYANNFDRGAEGFGFELGASYTHRDQNYDQYYLQGQVFNTVDCLEADVTDCPLGTLDNYAQDFDLDEDYTNIDFYFIDIGRVLDDWIAQGKPITSDTTDNDVASDYGLVEKILGIYGQVAYRADNYYIIGGLRYDSTQAETDVFALDDALIPGHVNDSDYYVPLSRDSEYDFFLPSVIGVFDLTDNMVLRAGYGQTIGRPNFSQLATTERIGVPNEAEGTIAISRGNPDLKPLLANNYDLSAEYYFDDGASLLSAALFYKDIDDQIYTQRITQDDFAYEGSTYTATIVQPINATSSSIYGLELTGRKDFAGMLPAPFDGLVLDTNLTLIDSEFTYLDGAGEERSLEGWENQPTMIANVQLSYEQGPFGAKVAYNYIDDFFSKAIDESDDTTDLYREGRSVIDLQARYQVNDSFRLVAEAQNLTEEGVDYTRRFPDGNTLSAAKVQRGRTLWLGATWTPDLR